jgi:hypothetical protein
MSRRVRPCITGLWHFGGGTVFLRTRPYGLRERDLGERDVALHAQALDLGAEAGVLGGEAIVLAPEPERVQVGGGPDLDRVLGGDRADGDRHAASATSRTTAPAVRIVAPNRAIAASSFGLTGASVNRARNATSPASRSIA